MRGNLIKYVYNLFNQEISKDYYFEILQLGLIASYLLYSSNSTQMSDQILLRLYQKPYNIPNTNPFAFMKILFNFGNHKFISGDIENAYKFYFAAYNYFQKIQQTNEKVSYLKSKIYLRLIECSMKIYKLPQTQAIITEFTGNFSQDALKYIEGNLFIAKCFFENNDCNLSWLYFSNALQKLDQIQDSEYTIMLKCLANLNLSILYLYVENIEPCIVYYEKFFKIYEHLRNNSNSPLLNQLYFDNLILGTIIQIYRRDMQSLEAFKKWVDQNTSNYPVEIQFSFKCLLLYLSISFQKVGDIDLYLVDMENDSTGNQVSHENIRWFASLKAFLYIVFQNYENASKEFHSMSKSNLKPTENFLIAINSSILHFLNCRYSDAFQSLRHIFHELHKSPQEYSPNQNRFEFKELLTRMKSLSNYTNDRLNALEDTVYQNLQYQ